MKGYRFSPKREKGKIRKELSFSFLLYKMNERVMMVVLHVSFFKKNIKIEILL